jgi:uncharacterized protein YdcH (DUF465 family)
MALMPRIRRTSGSELQIHSLENYSLKNYLGYSASAPMSVASCGLLSFFTNQTRRTPMFEHRQEQMEQLKQDNEDFLRVYNRHQELDKRVTAAEVGTAPMEDLALNQLKKEKLWAKDQLARIMDTAIS